MRVAFVIAIAVLASVAFADNQTDPCAGVTCNTLPPIVCNGNNLITYSMPGTCSNGVCSYPSSTTACQYGCSEGACIVQTACTGVTCNSPPAATCEGNNRVVYDSTGACAAGVCTYPHTTTACQYGCTNGICLTDSANTCPNGCNTPTANVCEGNNLRTYNSPGTCTNGVCSYSSYTTNCQYGCTNGACVQNGTAAYAGNCFDSDNGQSYTQRGSVTYNLNYEASSRYTLTDSCSGNTLNEYYCTSDGLAQTGYYACPYGCSEGACKAAECASGQTQTATCASGTTYTKYNCVEGKWISVNYLADPCGGDTTAATPMYRYAKWTCGANYTTVQGSESSCKDAETWRQYAAANCSGMGREVTAFYPDARCDVTSCASVACASPPPGCYYAEAAWKNGCQTDCGRLTCTGTCNYNGICERGEENCKDCVIRECPLTTKCSDGSTKTCYKSESGCRCEPCPIPANTVPFGCTQATDDNGFTRVMCDDYKQRCPVIDSSMKERCSASGGIATARRDTTGCEHFYCEFSSDTSASLFGNAQCPTPDALSSELRKCESIGLRSVVAFENGCKIGKCVQAARDTCEPVQRESIDECKNKGGGVMYYSDENGCSKFTCTAASECSQDMPKEAYEKCADSGGQLIVKRGDNSCIAFSECVRRGDSSSAYVEKITTVPDSTELLSIAFKMEDLRLNLDRLSKKSADIADYYRTTGSTEENRFRRVSDMFGAARDRVDEIRAKIRERLDKLTADDMTEIKSDMRYIKDVMIKDVLYIMLGSGDDIDGMKNGTSKDCGHDENCFNNALRICQPVRFLPDGDIVVEITGLEDNKCVLYAKLGSNDMTCKIEKYSLGIKNPETDIFPHCSGPLLEVVKAMSKESVATRPSSDIGYGGGGDFAGGFGEGEPIPAADYPVSGGGSTASAARNTQGESCMGCFDNGVCDKGECTYCADCK